MTHVGIDPGKAGGIAVLDGAAVRLHAMPLVKACKGKGRDEYDLVAIRDLLRWFAGWAVERGEQVFVTVEKSQPMPPSMGGGLANYHRGVSRGWEWMLVALMLPYQLVAPKTWQRVMLAGTPGNDTKQRAILAAQRLFPGADLRRGEKSKKVDVGFCEAILLAEYGRRTCSGVRS